MDAAGRAVKEFGAELRVMMSRKVNTKYLRIAIAVIIAVTGVRMWSQVLTR